MKPSSLLGISIAAAFLVPVSQAGDFYVDAVAGDNGNTGTAPGDAWLTLTHAVQSLPGVGHTLHVAPGTYDADLGEAFPIPLDRDLLVIGEGGAATTVVDGGGTPVLFALQGEYQLQQAPTEIVALTLRNALVGLDCEPGPDLGCSAVVRRTRIEDMADVGIRVWARAQVSDCGSELELDEVVIEACGGAVRARSSAWDQVYAFNNLFCTDSRIHDNGSGLSSFSDPAESGSLCSIYVARSSFVGNAGPAVSGTGGAFDVWWSLLAGNDVGFQVIGGDGVLSKCTVVDGRIGVQSLDGSCEVADSIVVDNGRNLFGGGWTVTYSDIGTGSYAGTAGNISVDPLFWAPEVDEFRLMAGSPCIDAADPNGPRDPDGSVGDMGAFVFDPSYVPEARTYCEGGANSVGPDGASMSYTGSQILGTNDFVLEASGLPAGVPGLFFLGPSQVRVPFGDGYRCVGGVTHRLNPPVAASAQGSVTRRVDFTTPPASTAVVPMIPWHFQLWYRDPSGPGGSGFNTSNGLTAWFLP